MTKTIQIELFSDGDKQCALIGPDLQEGIAGFSDDGIGAIRDLAKAIILAPDEAIMTALGLKVGQ